MKTINVIAELKTLLQSDEFKQTKTATESKIAELEAKLLNVEQTLELKNQALERELLRLHDLIADKFDRFDKKLQKKLDLLEFE